MFSELVYEPSEMNSIFKKPRQIELKLNRLDPSTSERNLIIAILHCILGLPSDIFTLKDNKFTVNDRLLQLNHITHQVLQNQLTFFVLLANQMHFLRQYIKCLTSCRQKILEAFGIGLQKIVGQIQMNVCQRLKTIQQQEGHIIRSQQQYHQSRMQPTTLIGLSITLAPEKQTLARIISIIELLPPLNTLSNEDSQRAGLFLLNFYFKECDSEYLTGATFKMHKVFGECLKVYLQLCKCWIAASEKVLLVNKNCGFFINLNLAFSMDKQKMLDVKKTVSRQMIPNILSTNYKRLFQLGKTVQFIKLYFKQQELFQFMNFFDIDTQFKPIQSFLHQLITPKCNFFAKLVNQKQSTSISSRISKDKIHKKIKLQTFQTNPFGINQQPSDFFYLRSQLIPNQKQIIPQKPTEVTGKISLLQNNEEKTSVNRVLINLMNEALGTLAAKCRAVLKKNIIKTSIEQSLRGIKQFVLLGQGDFVQQFLQLSQTLLEKPTDKISRNNVQRIIEQAIKNSASSKMPQSVRQSVSFVFLRTDQGTIKGWRNFSFAFKSDTPASCIFTSPSMQGYECIGSLLFNLRHCQQILVSYWQKAFIGKAVKLLQARNAVHRFVCALQSYLFASIEQIWNGLVEQFQSCESVLGLMQANETVLQKLRELTIENKPLCNSMLSLVKIIERFESINKQYEENRGQVFATDLEQIWSWFLSMLDQAKQIRNFADSFDFRLDY